MTRGLPPEQYGSAATSWGIEFFQIRILEETSKDRLRAAIEAEINRDGETRQKRIAIVNKQLKSIE